MDAALGSIRLADGRDLTWRASGPLAAPPLLWLHGSTGSSRTAPTTANVRVISYDRPGYGTSSLNANRSLVNDVTDVLALLDAHGIAQTAVLAFSGGAATGYALAALAPWRISQLGVVSGATWPFGPPPPDDVLRVAAAGLGAHPAAMVADLAAGAPPLDRQALQLPRVAVRLQAGIEDAVWAGVEGWVVEARLIRTAWPFAPRDVRCPVRLWHGLDDHAVPVESARAVARALPAAQLHTFAGAGPLGWLTQEDAIVLATLGVTG